MAYLKSNHYNHQYLLKSTFLAIPYRTAMNLKGKCEILKTRSTSGCESHLKENGTYNSDRYPITWTYYIVWCHIKSQCNHFSMAASPRHSRPFSSGMLEESDVFHSLLYSVSPISALGMEVFWRWVVRSDTGCFGLCDILEAKEE